MQLEQDHKDAVLVSCIVDMNTAQKAPETFQGISMPGEFFRVYSLTKKVRRAGVG